MVQFSNDVRVEVAPQYMPLDELKRQLDEMVRVSVKHTCDEQF